MTIKNDLYFLREPRTGGTLFESLIRHKVGDKFTCFTHHQIEFIKNIPVNPNTVILRSARKNLVEHFFRIFQKQQDLQILHLIILLMSYFQK
jgi:ABC-type phosphate/phosphonate transport system ATPase subunit